ncbi:MAG: cupin-like domain-containing protein [Pyrinomonadaceae bacterium]
MSVIESTLDPVNSPDTASSIVDEVASDERDRMLASQSFRFRHQLGGHPSMGMPEIRNLVEQMLAEQLFDQIFYKTGKAMAVGRYSDAESSKDIVKVIENMSTSGTWLRLTRVDEVTSQFNEIVERLYNDLSELYQQDIKSRAMRTFVTLFISSPGAYTNYHMDHTWNFLLQISGRKEVHLYDPFDQDVLTQKDKEGWYMKNFTISPKAIAKDIVYDLGPGDGVHHPVNAPHWVQNGKEISISLSLGLCLHESNRDAKVYQANYLMRRFGLRPTPPHRSEWRDRIKSSFISLWSDRNSESLNGAVFSGGDRLSRFLRIAPSEQNQYEPK